MKYFKSLIIMFILSLSPPLYADNWGDYQKSGDNSPKWNPLVEAAFTAQRSGNMSASISFFEKAIEKGCKDGLVYLNMGIHYEDLNDLERSRKYLELAKKYLPKNYPNNDVTKSVHEHLGRIYFSLGDLPSAKIELTRAVELTGENFTLMFLLGSIARQENDVKSLLNYYEKALTLPIPDETNKSDIMITILVEIGRSYYMLEMYDPSLQAWQRILEINPKHPIAKQFTEDIRKREFDKQMDEQQKRIFDEMFK